MSRITRHTMEVEAMGMATATLSHMTHTKLTKPQSAKSIQAIAIHTRTTRSCSNTWEIVVTLQVQDLETVMTRVTLDITTTGRERLSWWTRLSSQSSSMMLMAMEVQQHTLGTDISPTPTAMETVNTTNSVQIVKVDAHKGFFKDLT